MQRGSIFSLFLRMVKASGWQDQGQEGEVPEIQTAAHRLLWGSEFPTEGIIQVTVGWLWIPEEGLLLLGMSLDWVCSFIYLFHKYLLSTYCIPAPGLGTENAAGDKSDTWAHSALNSAGEMDRKWIIIHVNIELLVWQVSSRVPFDCKMDDSVHSCLAEGMVHSRCSVNVTAIVIP